MGSPYLEAGTELDVIVAKHVYPKETQAMGWHGAWPAFSTDYSYLEDLLRTLAAGWFINIGCSPRKEYPWYTTIFRSHDPKEQGEPDDEEFTAYGRTLPHAIALVAAKAYGWEG